MGRCFVTKLKLVKIKFTVIILFSNILTALFFSNTQEVKTEKELHLQRPSTNKARLKIALDILTEDREFPIKVMLYDSGKNKKLFPAEVIAPIIKSEKQNHFFADEHSISYFWVDLNKRDLSKFMNLDYKKPLKAYPQIQINPHRSQRRSFEIHI